MIYCPKCSASAGKPCPMGSGHEASFVNATVMREGRLIVVVGRCRVCHTLIRVEQSAQLNEDGSYTILSVAQ
jgi:hypothetical protein